MLYWYAKLLRVCMCTALVCLLSPVFLSEPSTTLESYNRYAARNGSIPANTTTQDSICLATALYYEAGNQSPQGKEAVALVILNRVNDPRFPKSICRVVKQSTVRSTDNRRICQFSYWCEEVREKEQAVWNESVEIAKRVLKNYWDRDIINTAVDGALYFHADYVKPKWRTQKVFLGQIGNHLFYGESKLS